MWFDGVRQPDTLYVASVSRGKDSTAMLRAIQLMGWPLDMITAVDIWATDDIPAELPPMVAFKVEWDEKCLERFGLPVTRLCARRKVDERERERETFERRFYSAHVYGNARVAHPERDGIYGFPIRAGAWCNSKLKVAALRENDIRERFLSRPEAQTEASQRERERERERGQANGIRSDQGELVLRTQDKKSRSDISLVSPTHPNASGVPASRNARTDRYSNGQGWATRHSLWCNSRLKSRVLDRPFLNSPGTRGEK